MEKKMGEEEWKFLQENGRQWQWESKSRSCRPLGLMTTQFLAECITPQKLSVRCIVVWRGACNVSRFHVSMRLCPSCGHWPSLTSGWPSLASTIRTQYYVPGEPFPNNNADCPRPPSSGVIKRIFLTTLLMVIRQGVMRRVGYQPMIPLLSIFHLCVTWPASTVELRKKPRTDITLDNMLATSGLHFECWPHYKDVFIVFPVFSKAKIHRRP